MRTLLERLGTIEQDAIQQDEKWPAVISPFAEVLSEVSEEMRPGMLTRLYSSETSQHLADQPRGVAPSSRLRPGGSAADVRWNLQLLQKVRSCPALIEGSSGTGKTTWIYRFFALNSVAKTNTVAFIDCSDPVPAASGDFTLPEVGNMWFVAFNAARDALKEHCPSGYQAEDWTPTRFSRLSIYELQDQLKTAIETLRAARHGPRVWLVLDNVDRAPVTKQLDYIRNARAIKRQIGLEVLVVVRPTTIRNGLGLLEEIARHGYEPVQAPRYTFSGIMKKRVEAAGRRSAHLRNIGEWTIQDADGLLHQFRTQKQYESLYRQICKTFVKGTFAQDFLLTCHNGDFGLALRDLSTRLGFSVFASHIVSGRMSKSPQVFLSAYLQLNQRHNWPVNSGCTVNVFRLSESPGRPLLAVRILEMIRATPYGIVMLGQLTEKLAAFGYTEVEQTLKTLLKARLIEDVAHHTNWETTDREFQPYEDLRLSRRGEFHITRLLHEVRFMNAISHGHPLPDEVVCGDMTVDTTIAGVAQNTAVFVNAVYSWVYEDLAAIETYGATKSVASFMHEVAPVGGLYIDMARGLHKALQQIDRRQEVSQQTWKWWLCIEMQAERLDQWRNSVLAGTPSRVQDLPSPGRLSAF